MKIIYYIGVLLLVVLGAAAKTDRGGGGEDLASPRGANKDSLADSIMQAVINQATTYADIVSHYDAEIYTRGYSEIRKKNFLIRFANHILPVDYQQQNMVFEMVSQSKFEAPNSYQHSFKAINGSIIPDDKKQREVFSFLNLNVYAPTVYNEAILMPIAGNAFSLYTFSLEGVQDTLGRRVFRIKFTPKIVSQNLIYGDLYVLDRSWTIDKIEMSGQSSFAEFRLLMSFNRDIRRFTLPRKADLFLKYNVLGNIIESSYHSSYKYGDVKWELRNPKHKRRKELDQTQYYRVLSDTVPIITDTLFWNEKRDTPLSEREQALYAASREQEVEQPVDTTNMTKYLKLTQQLTNTVNMDYQTTRLKYSGILNPFQLGYSGSDGITYRQSLRLSKTFAKDRQLRFRPELGYMFKPKDLFFRAAIEWEYKPEKFGVVSVTAGNDNQGYSSEITNTINEELKDSTFNFDNLDLQYFKHYFVELRNDFELFNGFMLSLRTSYHRRVPTNSTAIDPGQEVGELLNENFHDFLITGGFSYTYRQYYWMDGHRKEYIQSPYPTISFELTRALPNVWSSVGDYERMEAQIHQSISLGLLRKIKYNVGVGFYTKQKGTYFADFEYFRRSNFPSSWNDRIGGVFNLLKGEWFNASDRYLQAHFMFESPFILFRFLKNKQAAKYVFSERFYLSQLSMPVLPSYTEFGYGLGNHIFNVGVFVGFERLEYQSIGFKFAFELFQ